MVEVDELGPIRRRRIRRQLAGLVGAATVQRIDELPPEPDGPEAASAGVPAGRFSNKAGWREIAWMQRQVDAGKGEEELYLAGDLLAAVMAVRSKDEQAMQQVWRRVDSRMRSIGFWLGQWSQWRHALRR